MPYIVTTTEPRRAPVTGERYVANLSRRAVATLAEAQEAAHVIAQYARGDGSLVLARDVLAIAAIPESGGTVTLPDGTVIEVSRELDWFPIMVGAGIDVNDTRSHAEAELLAAFNAREQAAC